MNQNQFAQTGSQRIFDTVVQGDCIEVMRRISSSSVDFILADPSLFAELSFARRAQAPERHKQSLAQTDLYPSLPGPPAQPLLRLLLLLA